jgi:hypothetical protein
MNAIEARKWIRETNRSKNAWRTDEVLRMNHGIYLIYKGGENGTYLEVLPDGKATFGYYRGAMPCITDAEFEPVNTRQFESVNDALTKIMEKMGVHFLITAICDLDRR